MLFTATLIFITGFMCGVAVILNEIFAYNKDVIKIPTVD